MFCLCKISMMRQQKSGTVSINAGLVSEQKKMNFTN